MVPGAAESLLLLLTGIDPGTKKTNLPHWQSLPVRSQTTRTPSFGVLGQRSNAASFLMYYVVCSIIIICGQPPEPPDVRFITPKRMANPVCKVL